VFKELQQPKKICKCTSTHTKVAQICIYYYCHYYKKLENNDKTKQHKTTQNKKKNKQQQMIHKNQKNSY